MCERKEQETERGGGVEKQHFRTGCTKGKQGQAEKGRWPGEQATATQVALVSSTWTK